MWVTALGVTVCLAALVGYTLWWWRDTRLPTLPEPAPVHAPALLSERCDVCGAQAYLETLHNGAPLSWCVHHYRKHQRALTPFLIRDASDQLLERLEAS